MIFLSELANVSITPDAVDGSPAILNKPSSLSQAQFKPTQDECLNFSFSVYILI